MAFLGFHRRGHEHDQERPDERNWGDRTRDWGERRFGAGERVSRERGRDVGDYYGPERSGTRRFEQSDEFGWNRGGRRDEGQRGGRQEGRQGEGQNEWRGQGRDEWRDYGRERDSGFGRSSSNDRWQESYGPRAGMGTGSGYRGSSSEGYDQGDREQGSQGAYWSPERSSFGDFGRGGEMSTYGSGQFRGKGPKGYRRSDERIREDVCECLTEDDRIDASNVEVQVRECEVTLTGSVNSRDEKRRAEDLIDQLPGVRDVNNTLRVVNEGGAMPGSQTRQSTQGQSTQGQSTQGGMQGTRDQGSRH